MGKKSPLIYLKKSIIPAFGVTEPAIMSELVRRLYLSNPMMSKDQSKAFADPFIQYPLFSLACADYHPFMEKESERSRQSQIVCSFGRSHCVAGSIKTSNEDRIGKDIPIKVTTSDIRDWITFLSKSLGAYETLVNDTITEEDSDLLKYSGKSLISFGSIGLVTSVPKKVETNSLMAQRRHSLWAMRVWVSGLSSTGMERLAKKVQNKIRNAEEGVDALCISEQGCFSNYLTIFFSKKDTSDRPKKPEADFDPIDSMLESLVTEVKKPIQQSEADTYNMANAIRRICEESFTTIGAVGNIEILEDYEITHSS